MKRSPSFDKLTRYLDQTLKLSPICTEPCVFHGHIGCPLLDLGHKVVSFDIDDNGFPGVKVQDFLTVGPEAVKGDIICSPPRHILGDFVNHCIEVTPKGHRTIICLTIQDTRLPEWSRPPDREIRYSVDNGPGFIPRRWFFVVLVWEN
jgi:hypothetical protein